MMAARGSCGAAVKLTAARDAGTSVPSAEVQAVVGQHAQQSKQSNGQTMEKINMTIKQETLDNVVTELKRDNALAIIGAVFGAIKNAQWSVVIEGENGDGEKITSARQFRDYLIGKYSKRARNEMIKKLTSSKSK
jgi:hypothetical protein